MRYNEYFAYDRACRIDSDPDPKEDEVVSVLVKSLRHEPLKFVRHALAKAGVLAKLEPMLSVRSKEEEYEKGSLGLSIHFATQTIINCDIRFKQFLLAQGVLRITKVTKGTPRKQSEL